MNIFHINCNYVGTALHRIMVNHLQEDDAKITVFTPLWDRNQALKFHSEDNEIIRVCFNRIDRLLFFEKQRKVLKTIHKEVDSLCDYQLIHAFTLLTDGNAAYRISKKYNIPYIVAIRDTDINDFFRLKPYLRPLGIKIMRNASAVFFLSESYKQSVFERFIPKRYQDEIGRKTYVIPNGIDDFWFDNLYTDRDINAVESKMAEKKLSVVCVGKINKRKNIPTVQKALSIMRSKGWDIEFNVIGKVEDKSEIEIIKKDSLTSYFPPTNKEGLIDFYRKADIFVLASHTETFGLVYAEAMSQGLPVIYTRGQGFDGQFPDGEVGYAVCDTDPQEIAEAIEKLCMNYRVIASNVVGDVQKFKWDDICKKYREIYRGITDGRD